MTNNQSNELKKAIEQCFIKNNMCDCGEEHKDLGIDETEFFDVDSVVKDIQALIQDRERQARISELKMWEVPENLIQQTFASPCNICGFDYKKLRQMQQDRLEQLKGDES